MVVNFIFLCLLSGNVYGTNLMRPVRPHKVGFRQHPNVDKMIAACVIPAFKKENNARECENIASIVVQYLSQEFDKDASSDAYIELHGTTIHMTSLLTGRTKTFEDLFVGWAARRTPVAVAFVPYEGRFTVAFHTNTYHTLGYSNKVDPMSQIEEVGIQGTVLASKGTVAARGRSFGLCYQPDNSLAVFTESGEQLKLYGGSSYR